MFYSVLKGCYLVRKFATCLKILTATFGYIAPPEKEFHSSPVTDLGAARAPFPVQSIPVLEQFYILDVFVKWYPEQDHVHVSC